MKYYDSQHFTSTSTTRNVHILVEMCFPVLCECLYVILLQIWHLAKIRANIDLLKYLWPHFVWCQSTKTPNCATLLLTFSVATSFSVLSATYVATSHPIPVCYWRHILPFLVLSLCAIGDIFRHSFISLNFAGLFSIETRMLPNAILPVTINALFACQTMMPFLPVNQYCPFCLSVTIDALCLSPLMYIFPVTNDPFLLVNQWGPFCLPINDALFVCQSMRPFMPANQWGLFCLAINEAFFACQSMRPFCLPINEALSACQ